MRGYSDASGHSPFWESLGQKFSNWTFPKPTISPDWVTRFYCRADAQEPDLSAFLSEEAQACVARVHDQTGPALALLKREGFNTTAWWIFSMPGL